MYCPACMKIFKRHKDWVTTTKVPIVHQVSASHVHDSRSAGCQICSLLFDQLKAYEELFRKSTKKSRSSSYTVCDVEANADEVELVHGHDEETDPCDDRVKASGLSFSFKFRWTNAMRYSYRGDFPPPVEYCLMADTSIDLPSTNDSLLTYHQRFLKHLRRRNVHYPGEAIRSWLFKNVGFRHAAKTTHNVVRTRTIGCLPGSLKSMIHPRKSDW